jgi:hypothetical protein
MQNETCRTTVEEDEGDIGIASFLHYYAATPVVVCHVMLLSAFLCCTVLSCRGDFVVVGDLMNSITLLVYKAAEGSLEVRGLGTAMHACAVYAA